MPRRINAALPFAAVILLTLFFFYKLAFTDLIMARGDTYAYFYPYWDARDAALAQGELPLWSPHLFMGVPLLANPQLGTLYPPNWLTIPFNAPDSIRISILQHVSWATLGAYLLARRVVGLEVLPALLAAGLFGFGGHTGAHVEQINQLQGLAWMPWLFLLFALALEKPGRFLPLLGVAWALQLLSGHTQTAFISGVGLALYGLMVTLQESAPTRTAAPTTTLRQMLRVPLLLMVAAALAALLALPQLIPTQELTSLSNRGDGLSQHEATAFSLHPFLVGRGLLPSYDGQPFGEYVGYVGVVGLALAVMGSMSGDRRRWAWLVIAAVGLFLAFGRHNPVYWTLAGLPGFNLFRVPARWLALTALAAAMLAGLGAQALLRRDRIRDRHTPAVILLLVGGLAALSLLSDRAADEVDGPAVPTAITFFGWGMALVGFLVVYVGRKRYLAFVPAGVLICVLAFGELWIASHTLPYTDLSDPAVYNEPRFAINQMRVYTHADHPPGRMLSISQLYFDPGDRAALEARWQRMGISERAARYAFTATKMQETLSPNLPLTWGIPSVDGFDGGVLPTQYFTAFSSLLLPDGALRTIDGRLREVLAQPECRGACLPDDRWLDLMHVRYLLTDKVYDVWHEDIAYDTQFEINLAAGESVTLSDLPRFEGDSLNILYHCPEADCSAPSATFTRLLTPIPNPSPEFRGRESTTLARLDHSLVDGLQLARLGMEEAATPSEILISAEANIQLRAVTLVDRRTGDFIQLTPPGWRRVYSADIKIYENMDVLPRAFVVHQAAAVPDTWDGTEQALILMRDPDFDPAQTVVIHGDMLDLHEADTLPGVSHAEITEYTATQITVEVEATAPGYVVLTDAFYPGWEASGEDDRTYEIYRGNVMFRVIPVEAGSHQITLRYRPAYLREGWLLAYMGLVVVICAGGVLLWRRG